MVKNQIFKNLLFPILLLFSLQNVTAQYINYNITTGNTYATIPFKMNNDFIVIPLKLDRKLPLNFILDTGASNTIVIYKEYTDLLGTDYLKRLYIQGVDQDRIISALLTDGVDIELKEVTATNQHLVVLEENRIEFDKYAGTKIDGILGIDIFKRFIVKIDYEAKLIYLFEPKKHQYNVGKYSTIDIVKENKKIYFFSDITVSGKEHQVKWLVDSGAAMTVLIKNQESDSTLIPQGAMPGNIGKGLGGYISGYLGKLEEIKVSDYSFENVIGNYQVLADSIYTPAEEDILEGLMGNKILQQFHLIFDYHQNIIYLRPNKKYSKGISKDLSGMSIIASGLYLNEFTVEEIFPGSPADLAGIQKGDRIVKVNGRGTTFMGLEFLEKKLSSKEGNKIKLKLKRDKEKMKIQLYLKEYL